MPRLRLFGPSSSGSRSGSRSGSSKARSAVSERLIFVDGLEVWVREKSVKRLALRVQPPDGRIEVTTPRLTPDFEVARIVRSHRAWIEERQAAIETSPMAQADADMTARKIAVSAYLIVRIIRKYISIHLQHFTITAYMLK